MKHSDVSTQTNGLVNDLALGMPYSFRLPKPKTTDPIFGGSRTFWNQLILPTPGNGYRPPVKSVSTKKPGAVRGIRFILTESALAWFKKLEAVQNSQKTSSETLKDVSEAGRSKNGGNQATQSHDPQQGNE